jgi:uncharacterized membrane protein
MSQEVGSASKYYYVGGSLPYDAPSYVKRKADEDLYNYLQAREYCYVLNSRQMGKSSLRVKTKKQLEDNKIICASVDITRFGSNQTIQQWYTALIKKLSEELKLLDFQVKNWYREHQSLSPVQLLSEFIEKVILERIKENIVIFIDEIDAVRNLQFSTDEFFAFIRSCYNLRVDNPKYERLTFCLLGVATPSDLIRDEQCTPFNIGKKVDINGFNLDETLTLLQGLKDVASDPRAVAEKILSWTDGQPFLTQKICSIISKDIEKIPYNYEEKIVSDLVKIKIINNWQGQDEPSHLTTIRNAVISNQQRLIRVLGLYYKIKKSRKVESENSPEEWILRLSGLVIYDSGKLRINNKIYRRVFDKRWIESELGKWQPHMKQIFDWLETECQDESLLLQGQLLESSLERVEKQRLNDDGYKFLIASLKFENKQLKANVPSQNLVDESVRYQTNKENTLISNSQYLKEKSGIYKIKKKVIQSQPLKDESIEYQINKELKEGASYQYLKEKSAKYEIIQIFIGILLLLIAFSEGAVKSIMAFTTIILYIYLNYFMK